MIQPIMSLRSSVRAFKNRVAPSFFPMLPQFFKKFRAFPEEFVDRSEASTEQALRKWSLDVANNVQYNQNSNNRYPAYGHQIDLMLACQIKIRIDQGLPCDDISLRM